MTKFPPKRRALRDGSEVTLQKNHSKIGNLFRNVWPSFSANSPQHAGRIAKAWELRGRMPLGLRGGR